MLDTAALDTLVNEAAYPREAVQQELSGLDVALLLDLTPETREALVDRKKRLSIRIDQASEVRRRLLESKASISRLIANGHPFEPKPIEDAHVAQEIDRLLVSLRLARLRFRSEGAP